MSLGLVKECLHLLCLIVIPLRQSKFGEHYLSECRSQWPSGLRHELRGRAMAQAVSRWLPTAAVRGSKPDLVMWDSWWDKVALGQVFSEFFGFPCNRRSLHQLLHNHPHVSSGERTIGQCGRSAGTYRDLGDLNKRDLRNLNLGDLKKGRNGGVSPPPPQKKRHELSSIAEIVDSSPTQGMDVCIVCIYSVFVLFCV
jgi:hypothetical protein